MTTVLTKCPDDLTLMSYTIGATGDPRADARLATHVEQCEACRAAIGRHRELAADVRRATREPNEIASECLDEMAIAALADGVAADDDRVAGMAHLVTCGSCRSQLAELLATLDDAEIAAAMPRRSAPRRLRSLVTAANLAGLAAAAVLAFAIGPNRSRQELTAPMRDETGALVVAPVAAAPVGVVSRAAVFRWSSVPGASRYRVRVFDAEGVVVWETQTSDTAVALPTAPRLQRGARYLWKVEARTDFDRWVGSALTEFQLSPDGVFP